MPDILSISSILGEKRLKLRYYNLEIFYYDIISRTLFAPKTTSPLTILKVLMKL